MAFKVFVDGVVLPASDLNTYLMKQAINVCTSGTRPASPTEGQPIYETDTDRFLIYTTATTTWRQPWNLPWGYMGHAVVTSVQTGITTTVDLTGLTTTFTAVTNRRYRAMLHTAWDSTVSLDVAAINIYQGASPISYSQQKIDQAGNQITIDAFAYFTGSGSTTIKATGGRAAGSGTLQTTATATNQFYLIVDDLGPSGAPS